VAGDATRIYGHSVFLAAHDQYFHPGECLIPPLFDYPPISLFLTYPLGLITYLTAFGVWIGGSFLLYLATIYLILPRRAALVAAIVPVTVPANILLGHNGFVTAALMGLSLVLLESRPWFSGIFIGLLTYKPHLGLLFPFALLAARNWRALASATLTALLLGIAAVIAFGYEGWPAFVASVFDRNIGLSPNEVLLRHQSIYGLLNWAGASPWISWSLYLAVAAAVTLVICAMWAKPIPYPLKAAALGIGSVVVTPYVLPYDLCILSIGVAFFAKDGLVGGFLPAERFGLLSCFVGLFLLLFPTAPVGPFIDAIFLFLIGRRAAAYARGYLPSLWPNLVAKGAICTTMSRHGVSA
jgi:hypothetical protein